MTAGAEENLRQACGERVYSPYFKQRPSGFGIHLANKEKDPFEPFEDWLVDGAAGNWANRWEDTKPLTSGQKNIVAANAKLLMKEDAWNKRVNAFNNVLAKVGNEEERENKRDLYQIRFDQVEFINLDFSQRVFPCSVGFIGTTFSGNVYFYKTTFTGAVSFQNAHFSGDAYFNSMTISEDAFFGKVTFLGNADFEKAFFSGNANFRNAIFSGRANFGMAIFSGNANFGMAAFSRDTDFGKAAFSGNADFGNVTFSAKSFFRLAIFSGNADFRKAYFFGNTYFESAIFRKVLFLTGAVLPSTFMSASDMKVEGNLFIKSNFRGYADFSRLEVKGTTSLFGSEFHQVPDFTDAKLDRPPNMAGMVVPEPETQKEKWWQFSRAINSNDVVKLRKLKSMALDANDHEKDGEFFAKEMLAKRGVETTSFSGLLFNTIYWKLSDYGQSFLRPLVGLFCSLLIFPILYLVAVLWGQLRYPNWDELYLTLQLSMRNFLPFFGSLFRFSPQPEGHKSSFMTVYHDPVHKGLDADWLVAIGIVQNIIGAVLLFLFLLALRNKFRLK